MATHITHFCSECGLTMNKPCTIHGPVVPGGAYREGFMESLVQEPATHAQLAEIISLRDYMAMSALNVVWPHNDRTPLDDVLQRNLSGQIAKHAYTMADAMLAERAKNYEGK